MASSDRYASDIPRIHRLSTRNQIIDVAIELARHDGYAIPPAAFDWLKQEPRQRDPQTLNTRSPWYIRRAIAVITILKN
jgi:hypothetical protein